MPNFVEGGFISVKMKQPLWETIWILFKFFCSTAWHHQSSTFTFKRAFPVNHIFISRLLQPKMKQFTAGITWHSCTVLSVSVVSGVFWRLMRFKPIKPSLQLDFPDHVSLSHCYMKQHTPKAHSTFHTGQMSVWIWLYSHFDTYSVCLCCCWDTEQTGWDDKFMKWYKRTVGKNKGERLSLHMHDLKERAMSEATVHTFLRLIQICFYSWSSKKKHLKNTMNNWI